MAWIGMLGLLVGAVTALEGLGAERNFRLSLGDRAARGRRR